jgi:exodeoxyribonuclease III
VRIVTWNVNSLPARLPRVLELLTEHAPDVVCLQETKVGADAFPRDELAAAGYAAAEHGSGGREGVAILAPAAEPPAGIVAGLAGEPSPGQARWIEATVAGVRVVSVYVPNGQAVGTGPYAEKLAFLAAAAQRARGLAGGALAICGDMNVAPADADVYDPAAFAESTHVQPEERAALAAVRDAAGLVDAYRALRLAEPGFTWWDYRQGHFHKGLGLRIDHALLSPELAGRLVACGADRAFRKGAKPSDHAPLVVELAPAGQRPPGMAPGPHRDRLEAAIALEAEGQRQLLAGQERAGRAKLKDASRRYQESWDLAPPGSYGRLVGMVKAAIIAGEGPREAGLVRAALAAPGGAAPDPARLSPPAAYALALAALQDGDDALAAAAAARMRDGSEAFGRAADAITALAAGDAAAYAASAQAIVADFTARDQHLKGVPIADTALMLERLAAPRGLAAGITSPLLPPG